ncbi:MAG TPA: tyrosine--tRNA ligase, partial [Gammaproteobacteria bacterium]|nr:tyrosine--tRNA ligase [Gammaproteobacteria bacterium]
MGISNPDIISDLESRDLISQLAGGDELKSHLSSGSRTVYCGFDPTAESLHIGNMIPLLALKRFQLAGHKPIALVGGATGMIGDPSFKVAERQLNSTDVIESWVERIKPQLSQFLEFDAGSNAAIMVNNLEWTGDYDVLSFLRDVGKHFSVNAMIQKESVKQRIGREGEGISYTEFSYMILQSFDFSELYKRYGCTLQIGGSDQWGNITGGIDLTRRLHQTQVYGATFPLITKSDGSKFGKTEAGTIWMDPTKTSPYAFYQFWLNTADADVYKFLKYFTFLSVDEIDAIQRSDGESDAKPEAQGVLAREVTELLHGSDGREAATRISEALFSGDISLLTADDLAQLELDGLPCTELEGNRQGIVEVL